MTWREQAACRGHDVALFYPKASRPEREPTIDGRAALLCASCPVRGECLADAIEHGEQGTWGGLTARQRRDLERTGQIGQGGGPKATHGCGTHAGYVRHRKHGEDACDECKAAHSAYRVQRKRARRQEEAA